MGLGDERAFLKDSKRMSGCSMEYTWNTLSVLKIKLPKAFEIWVDFGRLRPLLAPWISKMLMK